MMASLCAQNVPTSGGFPVAVIELSVDQRKADHVRFSYGFYDGDRVVPAL
jgi:hypothetical protein